MDRVIITRNEMEVESLYSHVLESRKWELANFEEVTALTVHLLSWC